MDIQYWEDKHDHVAALISNACVHTHASLYMLIYAHGLYVQCTFGTESMYIKDMHATNFLCSKHFLHAHIHGIKMHANPSHSLCVQTERIS